MKLEFKSKVKSKTYIGNSIIETSILGKDFTLIPDEKGLLKEIVIITQVPNSKRVVSKIGPSKSPEAKHEINIDLGEGVVDEVENLLQYLESTLSFSANLEKISWEEPDLKFIPETEQDKADVNILSFSSQRSYPDEEKILTLDAFRDIVLEKEKYEFLTVVKSFYREGKREFNSFRYINAFYNFYFVIEDLYGNGKTKNFDIEKEFKNNSDFRSFVDWMITENLEGRHKKSIEQFLKEENKSFDIDGLIELIVRIRGNLHHFSTKSTKHKGTPLNQQDFESIAFLLLGLSVRSILQKIYERNKGLI